MTAPAGAREYADFAARLTTGGLISDPWFEGQPRFHPRPVVLTSAEQASLYRAAEEMAAAYNELCLHCAGDPALVAGFLGLTPVQQALWCASAPHWHGIARADVFLTAQGPVVCELNCDTPSGEAEAVLLNRTVAPAFPGLCDPNRELRDRFCAMIAAVAGPVGRCARQAGLFDTPCDVFVRHYKTDWWTERRPVWSDEPPVPDPDPLSEKLAVILGSALAGTCAVVNPFGAVVPQNKRAMALLWERMDLFSPRSRAAIRRYLPETVRLETLPPARLRDEREAWVLKSDYGCEGDEVVIGAETPPDVWEASLEAAVPGRWVAQRHFRALRGPDGAAANHGVYLVAGEASGLYTRLAVAGTDRHALSAPVLVRPEARP